MNTTLIKPVNIKIVNNLSIKKIRKKQSANHEKNQKLMEVLITASFFIFPLMILLVV